MSMLLYFVLYCCYIQMYPTNIHGINTLVGYGYSHQHIHENHLHM